MPTVMRIYVGRYFDPLGISKNGFSVHRQLRIRNNYGCSMKIANINLHSFRIHLQFDTLMKIKISQIFLFFSTLLLLYNSCRGIDLNSENQLHQDNIHISKWYRGASSAMAFMWDDTNANHYTSVGPLFDSFGYHTSFGVITISLNDHINGYKSLVANGHEICSHSVTHTNLVL